MSQSRTHPRRQKSAKPESILLEAHRIIYGDRDEEYGHPLNNYTRTAGMVNACFAHLLIRPLTPEECMTFMILVKLSRFQETAKRDTLVDIAGYAGTIGEATDERARREAKKSPRLRKLEAEVEIRKEAIARVMRRG